MQAALGERRRALTTETRCERQSTHVTPLQASQQPLKSKFSRQLLDTHRLLRLGEREYSARLG